MSPSRSGRKRGSHGRSPNFRARKKQKRLDAIRDKSPIRLFTPSDNEEDDDSSRLRRSSRARRAPEVLDSSPVPSNRKKKPMPSESPNNKENQSKKRKIKKKSLSKSLSFKQEEKEEDEEEAGWRSRLRSRAKDGNAKTQGLVVNYTDRRVSRKGKLSKRKGALRVAEEEIEKKDSILMSKNDVEKASDKEEVKVAFNSKEKSRRKKVSEAAEEKEKKEPVLISANEDDGDDAVEKVSGEVEEKADSGSDSQDTDEAEGASDLKELEASLEAAEAMEEDAEECTNTVQDEVLRKVVPKVRDNAKADENVEHNAAEIEKTVTMKEKDTAMPTLDNTITNLRVKEGRRCGLCGGGTDGKPPKKLVRESMDSDRETYEGSSASEEPNYDIWDGFGDEPGWLGRLLGPILDRFGIARVWVHQHCAIWSPEVYFAGLGCLKNVRTALCRGKLLKCSRCGRPGATIGCRVDRCMKTYHLPCSRAEGCIFDHRKFLIACHDHRHLFQPQGVSYSLQIRRRKARKLKLELRKHSNDAWRKDLEAEEKWLEHCGEDEEFLKREGKRLHRDILRIAPTYIGGSSDDEKLYEGWESVAGLEDVIQCMKEVVILPLLYPDFFNNLGLTPPRGVLLHGYPGTGKTLVVRALIGACSRGDKRIAYFARKGADCLGKYVGDAERQLRLLFQVAEKSQPSIIFFDEIDGLAPCRSRNQDQTHSSVVSTLLSLLDGLKSRGSVIVIGATNRPDSVDPALRRPGRFDREIYFPLPSEKDRSAILSLHTRSWPNPLSGTILSWIANQTVGYAGADLQALCTHAAMNALKRNFPLKELLSSAEKGAVHGKLPSLPSLIVEERDWLEALVLAQPPCSRREAGMAANDVVSSPLSSYLTTCLLKPLSLLLISFYNEERIWLPPVLYKASKSIRSIIVAFLEKRRLPATSWRSHVHYLLEDKHMLKEIEANLSHCGLVSGPSVSGDSFLSDNDNDYHEKFDPLKFRLSGASTCDSRRRLPLNLGNSSGFRVLISGSPRSGQKHLACCILHGFMGHVEIQKVNLATISQEGHGDLFRGLTQIISKCLNLGRCVIYMPRIDLWAPNENPTEEVEENQTAIMTTKSSSTASNGERSVSELWNSFVEEVESACRSASLIIVATCELQALPLGIKQFFSSDVLNAASAPSVHTIPRFFLQTDGTFDLQLVIDSSATKLSHDLVQSYVQLVYQRTHPSRSQEKMEVPNAVVVNSEAQRQNVENREEPRLMDAAQITFKQNQQGENSDISRLVSGQQEVGICPSNNQELFPKIISSKAIKGSSALPIVTFGFQILRYPQFAELCWVTSKLREGPSTDINGPWKGWPFNSCVMHGSSSPDKAQAGGNSNIQKEGSNSGVVRGLIAVGLLSYRGVYTSVLEVAIEIRKVLELLVAQVRAKILARKDRYQYLRILSQVAYIEDMVNSWAYTYQSSYMNNSATESSSKLVSAGRMTTENNLTGSVLMDIQSCVPNLHSKTYYESVPSESSAKSIVTDGQCISLSKGLSDYSLLKSSIPYGESSRTEDPSLAKKMNNVNHLNGPKLAESCLTSDGPNRAEDIGVSCNGLDTVISPRDAELSSEEPSKVADHSFEEELSCLYNCCSGCLNKLYALAREILSDRCKSSGHCSTVDDINNIVSSCSLNILAALRKCDNPDVHSSRTHSENCPCQHIGNKKLERPSNQSKRSEKMDFFAGECSCHLRNDESEGTRFDQGLTFFFRKGVLVSSEPLKDVLHCRYENFCLCSMVEKVLIMKKPLEYV